MIAEYRRMFAEHVERSFLDPKYSFDDYFQLGSRRNIRPIKNGLFVLIQPYRLTGRKTPNYLFTCAGRCIRFVRVYASANLLPTAMCTLFLALKLPFSHDILWGLCGSNTPVEFSTCSDIHLRPSQLSPCVVPGLWQMSFWPQVFFSPL